MVMPTLSTVVELRAANALLRQENLLLRRENEQLRQHTDHLTGVLLRDAWTVTAQERLPTLHQPALLFADVNNLKPVNDTHGHYLGDRLLREFAAQLRTQFGDQALIGRIGGDEFVILLDLPPTRHDRIRAATLACVVDIAEMTCGAAFGLARPEDIARRDTETEDQLPAATRAVLGQLDRLMHAADLALLRAKQVCRERTLSTAFEVYGPLDPAVPAVLDRLPLGRVRDGTATIESSRLEA